MTQSSVLLTGAAGRVGSVLRDGLASKHVLRLTDRQPLVPKHPTEEIRLCDLADADGIARLCEGMDAIVHMGALPQEGDWPQLLSANIAGTINIFEGARRAGVRRVVFASTNHVTGMHPRSRRLSSASPVRPDSRYGLTKAFGEDLGALYAYKHGIGSFCIRIGSFAARPQSERALATWVSFRDMVQLVEVGLTADYVHEIVYGVSANTRSWWDNDAAMRLGYRPQDNAETFAADVEHIGPKNPLDQEFQGGDRVADEFAGHLEWLRAEPL
jgi:uronate dehydrogenase